MSDPNTYADLDVRILEKRERGYPVEITFNGDQEFPRGFLDPSAQPQIERAFQKESGERLFRWLLATDELQAAWAQARGSRPLASPTLRRRSSPGMKATSIQSPLLPTEIASAANYLCTRVWRNLLMDEWTFYIGEDIPHERTCPNLPPGFGAPGGPR